MSEFTVVGTNAYTEASPDKFAMDPNYTAALRASHERLRKALEGVLPMAWHTHPATSTRCPRCAEVDEARAAIAEARGLGR